MEIINYLSYFQVKCTEKNEKNTRRKSSAQPAKKGKIIKFGWVEGVYVSDNRCN